MKLHKWQVSTKNQEVYESDQNSQEIKIKVDNKSVNKIPNFGYHLTTGVKTFYRLESDRKSTRLNSSHN